MGVGGQRHALATLPAGKRPGTDFTGGWRAPEPVGTGAENRVSTGIRSLDRPARSASLYRIRYPGPMKDTKWKTNIKMDVAESVLTTKIGFISRFGLLSRILVVMIVSFWVCKIRGIF
jgi:hypothetical protein